MEAVWRTVYDCLPPPKFTGSDLLCGSGGGGGGLSSSAVGSSVERDLGSSLDREDRISLLPDFLRRNIVSRLPIRDAVRTKVLSRRWCKEWAATPLHLDDAHLLRTSEKERIQRVSRILLEHPGPFHCVRLVCTSFDQRRDALSLWLSVLANKAVEYLVLVNKPMPVDVLLPIDVMRCTTLRLLCLGFFHIQGLLEHRGGGFPQLREVRLNCTTMGSADLSHMLRLSPRLESLIMVASYGLPDDIHVHSHQTLGSIVLWLCIVRELSVDDSSALKRVILWNTSASQMTLKIGRAQNLESLGYLEPGVHKLVIKNVLIQAGTKDPNIVVPSVNVLGCRLSFEDKKQSSMLLAFLRCFPHVETLHVQSVKANEVCGKFNLKTWLNKADGIKCVEEHIKKLFFHEFHGESSELAFLKFIWMKAKSLEQMVIILSEECLERADETQSKLIELGESIRASEQPHLLVIGTDDPMLFEMACDASVRDPFFCMDDFEPSTKDQVLASVMVQDVKPAVELGSNHHEQVGMMVKGVAPAVELNSGHMMPMVGLAMGPGLPNDKHRICDLIKYALQIGYRHFALAGEPHMLAKIGNPLAEACRDGIVKREDLFIALKVCSDSLGDVIQACRHTLGILGLEYIDLGFVDHPGDVLWRDLEKAVSLGLIRSIGLSRCHFAALMQKGCLPLCNKIIPAVNLVGLHPCMRHDALVNAGKKYGIFTMARCSMDASVIKNWDPIINSLALKYSKTPKQLILRWFLQRGTGVFDIMRERDTLENLTDLIDFKISDEDMKAIKRFD